MPQQKIYSNESVILLHGLARSKRSFSKLESILKKRGYHVVNQGYRSTKHTIEALSESVIPASLKLCRGNQKVHFVTHSLGGLILRNYMKNHTINNLGRIVMLGPPNNGCEIVDKLGSLCLFKFINGPAGLQLGTGPLDLPKSLGPVNYEVGVIAGTRSLNLFSYFILPGQDDGKVTVESTKLKGMKDHIILPVTHTFMMNNKSVISQIENFLANGYFVKKNQQPIEFPSIKYSQNFKSLHPEKITHW